MFKQHPILVMINLILSLIGILFLNNSIIITLIIIFCLFKNIYRANIKYNIFLKVALFISLVNIISNSFLPLMKLFLLIIYIREVIKCYTKQDIIYSYDSLNKTTGSFFNIWMIKCMYFKDKFIKNYNRLKLMNLEFGYAKNIEYYLYFIKQVFIKTRQDLDDIVKVYERRFYFNKKRNKYVITFGKDGWLLVTGHILIVILIFYIGSGYYAILN